jgi:hypothetical protein
MHLFGFTEMLKWILQKRQQTFLVYIAIKLLRTKVGKNKHLTHWK